MNKIITAPYKPTNFDVKSKSENQAHITVGPFASGYAITLAHPMRRLIMSSSVGHAPVALKIEGVKHEFDSIVGVFEDVSVFIMNLKNLRFKVLDEETDALTLDYTFSGHRDIKGSDLSNDTIEVTNPNAHLATLNEDANLSFSIMFRKGIGYVSSELFEIEAEGFIFIDAYFTPVKKAIYSIDKILVNDDPSFEKIVFDVTTDGRKSPIDVFKDAVITMNYQMHVFSKIVNMEIEETEEEDKKDDIDISDLLVRIEELNLTPRSFNSLHKANILYFGQVILMSETDLRQIKNLGKKSFEEIISKVGEQGYTLSYPVERVRKDAFDKYITV
jgi:DNA-directed RNA polymerase subunit alpha